jgi:hypothetical protein
MRWAVGGVAGILFVVLSFVATGINVMPPPHTADATSLAAWFAEHGDQYRIGHYVAGVGGVAMLGAATVILRTGVFARWLGWAGGAVGVAAIVGCAAIIENDPSGRLATISSLAWLGFFVWIVAVGIAMIRRGGPVSVPRAIVGSP